VLHTISGRARKPLFPLSMMTTSWATALILVISALRQGETAQKGEHMTYPNKQSLSPPRPLLMLLMLLRNVLEASHYTGAWWLKKLRPRIRTLGRFSRL
jgi:hypothetical protein